MHRKIAKTETEQGRTGQSKEFDTRGIRWVSKLVIYSNTAHKEQNARDANYLVAIYHYPTATTSPASPASAPPACCMDSDCARAALPVVELVDAAAAAAAAVVDVGVGGWAVGVEDSVVAVAVGWVMVAQPCAWRKGWDCGRRCVGETGVQDVRLPCPCDRGSVTWTSTSKANATVTGTCAPSACRVCLGLCCASCAHVYLCHARARQG
jgi:hypothetical protein